MSAILRAGPLAATLSDAERKFAVKIPSLTITSGSPLAVSGASGSGKTLLLEVLGLLRQPDAGGAYTFSDNGTEIDFGSVWRSKRRETQIRKHRSQYFGFVPQSWALVGFLNAWENARLPQRLSGRSNTGWLSEIFEKLGIAGCERMFPSDLSMGQRQRVAIARAIAHRPAIVFADEPTSALDPLNSEGALRLLVQLACESGMGVFLSSHDHHLLKRLGIPRYLLEVTADSDGTDLVPR